MFEKVNPSEQSFLENILIKSSLNFSDFLKCITQHDLNYQDANSMLECRPTIKDLYSTDVKGFKHCTMVKLKNGVKSSQL